MCFFSVSILQLSAHEVRLAWSLELKLRWRSDSHLALSGDSKRVLFVNSVFNPNMTEA